MPDKKNIVHEPVSGYEKEGDNLLREALKRSYKERFLMATPLYRYI